MFRLAFVLAGLPVLVACGGSSSGAPSEESASPHAAALAECDVSPASRAELDAPADLVDLAEGAWLGCPSHTLRPPAERTVGIELTRGTYTVLLEGSDGAVVRGAGIDATGEWSSEVLDGEVVIAVPGAGQSMSYFRPTFTEGPRTLRFEEAHSLFDWSRYVSIDLP
jgi:hypothetical protein